MLKNRRTEGKIKGVEGQSELTIFIPNLLALAAMVHHKVVTS
jgi:hypothetical protein